MNNKTKNEQERTVVGIGEINPKTGEEKTVYYYAYISDTAEYRELHVDDSYPLSEDEVEEFFKNEEAKLGIKRTGLDKPWVKFPIDENQGNQNKKENRK
jgi:hypothetical protein